MSCPAAAQAIHSLAFAVGDSMSVIEYHNNPTDPFTTTECENRENNYYTAWGHPIVWFDGVLAETGTNYRAKFESRKNVTAPLTIQLSGTYDSTSRQGTIYAHITNSSGGTVGGALRIVLTETNIAYAWEGEDSLFFVARDMLPNEVGETVVLNAGGDTTLSQPYTINSSWNAKNCDIIAFVQGANKEIYQGAKVKATRPGIEENVKTKNQKLTVCPNPFTSTVKISFQASDSRLQTPETKIKIYDISGKFLEETSGNVIGRDLKAGIYFVKAKVGNYTLSEKIIKTK